MRARLEELAAAYLRLVQVVIGCGMLYLVVKSFGPDQWKYVGGVYLVVAFLASINPKPEEVNSE